MKSVKLLIFVGLALIATTVFGQSFLENSGVSVNFQADGQIYAKDKNLGISDSTLNGRNFGLNSFMEVKYNYKNFTAGVRFEGYMPPLHGFTDKYNGIGVPYYFFNYKNKLIDVTAGSFYEQFGSGMLLRSYQNWVLGYDNALNGFRVKFTPFRGIYFTALAGVNRNYWIKQKEDNRGYVYGADLELNITELVGKDWGTNFSVGGSYVNKYEDVNVDKTTEIELEPGVVGEYKYLFPKNVGGFAGRFNVDYSGFSWMAEYAHKFADPANYTNPQQFIYHQGQGLYVSASYSLSGFGAVVQLKRVDNMKWKSRTMESGTVDNQIDINYIPSIAPIYQYSLQNMYPNACQPDGEAGIFGQLTYNVKKKTALGGKYGTNLMFSYTRINSIGKNYDFANAVDETFIGYNSPFLSVGDEKYYQDFYLQIDKKCTKDFKFTAAYMFEQYNEFVMEGHGEGVKDIHVGTVDATYKINNLNAIRLELQALFTGYEESSVSRFKGNWLAGTLEYSLAPNWFISIQDEWNYGNKEKGERNHYIMGAVAYTTGSTRVALSYGRQRAGLLCVGGVCRYVPRATGVSLSITSSF